MALAKLELWAALPAAPLSEDNTYKISIGAADAPVRNISTTLTLAESQTIHSMLGLPAGKAPRLILLPTGDAGTWRVYQSEDWIIGDMLPVLQEAEKVVNSMMPVITLIKAAIPDPA